MSYTIFCSWQSDTPGVCNRTFIGNALKAAAEQLQLGATLVDSPALTAAWRVFQALPKLPQSCFRRFESALFGGDMTLTGEAHRHDGETRKVPIVTHLLRLALPRGVIGWECVICVMNAHQVCVS